MSDRRKNGPFRNVGKHRGYHRIAKALGNLTRQKFNAHVMFAQSHVWTILLGATDRNQNGGGTMRNFFTQLE